MINVPSALVKVPFTEFKLTTWTFSNIRLFEAFKTLPLIMEDMTTDSLFLVTRVSCDHPKKVTKHNKINIFFFIEVANIT
jgi:hypothetical protein